MAGSDLHAPLATPFSLFLLQVLVILSFSRLINALLSRLRQPAVVGEMIAGILLGPTALGHIPGWKDTLFPKASLDTLNTVASFGLCFFMFAVGMEMDLASVVRNARASAFISLSGLALPGAVSYALALLFGDPAYSKTSFGTLGLFLTCALGIISLPVLARILAERRAIPVRVRELAMSVAVVEDILAYVLLAIVTVLVKADASSADIGIVVGATIGECLFVFFVLRYAVAAVVARGAAINASQLSAGTFLFLSVCLLLCCFLTNIIGLSFMIGAFQFGLIVPRTSSLAHQLSEKSEFFATTILMPLYFAASGLKTDFGSINSATSWGLAVLLIAAAGLSKFAAVYAACRFNSLPHIMSKVVAA